jgi:hypothetical protein
MNEILLRIFTAFKSAKYGTVILGILQQPLGKPVRTQCYKTFLFRSL